GDDEPWVVLDGADAVDLDASAINLATAYAELVGVTFPEDEVAVLPADEEGGLCAVEFYGDDFARLEELTEVPTAQMDDPQIEGPTLIAETVHGLLFDALQTEGWAIARV
ncbi:MAG TPA: hypothetical protein VER37_04560, partial [Thermomicrobiales bacterium]|nr:hypothetical protein [Thermomicrobiales bacterium]